MSYWVFDCEGSSTHDKGGMGCRNVSCSVGPEGFYIEGFVWHLLGGLSGLKEDLYVLF